jgi:hypothetical protein
MATTQDKTLASLSKRMKVVRGKIDHAKSYAIDDALKLVKETATAKFVYDWSKGAPQMSSAGPPRRNRADRRSPRTSPARSGPRVMGAMLS